jgi:hypothetical protein
MIVQLVPFHCSISVPLPPVDAVNVPTAQMSLAELAAIPNSELLRPAFGLETMLQLVHGQEPDGCRAEAAASGYHAQ